MKFRKLSFFVMVASFFMLLFRLNPSRNSVAAYPLSREAEGGHVPACRESLPYPTLKSSEKDRCLAELSRRFPELLQRADIRLSEQDQNELARQVTNYVQHFYFPSTADYVVRAITGPIGLMYTIYQNTAGPYAVLFSSNNGAYPALETLARDRIASKRLDNIIYNEILDTQRYRDCEEEARKLAAIRERAAERERTRAPLTFSNNRPSNMPTETPAFRRGIAQRPGL